MRQQHRTQKPGSKTRERVARKCDTLEICRLLLYHVLQKANPTQRTLKQGIKEQKYE